MGEIADMMLDGMLCQMCGELIEAETGYPTVCPGCQHACNCDEHGNSLGEQNDE